MVNCERSIQKNWNITGKEATIFKKVSRKKRNVKKTSRIEIQKLIPLLELLIGLEFALKNPPKKEGKCARDGEYRSGLVSFELSKNGDVGEDEAQLPETQKNCCSYIFSIVFFFISKTH